MNLWGVGICFIFTKGGQEVEQQNRTKGGLSQVRLFRAHPSGEEVLSVGKGGKESCCQRRGTTERIISSQQQAC